jgi:glycosyltransferase involved in cell wall biosynthesis
MKLASLDARPESGPRHPSPPDAPIRVAWDLGLVGRNRTGTGTYVRAMTCELGSLPELDLHILRGWPTILARTGIVGRATRALIDATWIQFGLPRALDGLGVDLLHSPISLSPLQAPCPVVVTMHDAIHRRFPEDYRSWWIRYLEFMVPRVLRRAAAVIADSECTKRDLIDTFGLDPGVVRVIYLGVDLHRFNREAALKSKDVLMEYGIRSDYVLHVGALVGRKNIPLLLEAVAILRSRGVWQSRQLVLTGGASPGLQGARDVYASVERFGLGDTVVFTEHVPAAWLPPLYANAAVFAFPSKYEGFGLPVIEAMASGTPVIASAGSAVTEIASDAALLIDGDAAIDFADGLERILEDEALKSNLRSRGLRRAATFSWSRAAAQTAQVYKEVARKGAD